MKTVIIFHNALDPSSRAEHRCAHVGEFLRAQFGAWPATARIYRGQVSRDRDITPSTEAEIARLEEGDDPIYVVVYPGELTTIALAVVAVALSAITFLLAPQIPNAAKRNTKTASPNNGLSDRVNSARPRARIPDIVGQVRSTPDLICAPWKVFENNREVEYAYLCVGRGEYEFADVRDGETLIADIPEASVEIYGPGKNPIDNAPDTVIGDAITQRLLDVRRSNSVTGQTLVAPNARRVKGDIDDDAGIRFAYPNLVQIQGAVSFLDLFEVGETVRISHSTSSSALNFDGDYEVENVTADTLYLVDPELVNSDWIELEHLPDGRTEWLNAVVDALGLEWVGWFVIDNPDLDGVILNFIADNGLYRVRPNGNQRKTNVQVEIEIQPLDASLTPSGPAVVYTRTLEGSSTSISARGLTFQTTAMETSGRVRVRARRLTLIDSDFEGQIVDEVKWRDLYSSTLIPTGTEFGDLTTIYSRTVANAGALAIKERKLNALVTRKIKQRITGTTFTTDLFPVTRADDILVHLCRDPKIGNRSLDELDLDNIYNTIAGVQSYFGTEKAVEFCHTFDDSDLSFEETVAMVANAIFCTAFRQGSRIGLYFEQETDNSVLLFNHRNKRPRTETRTVEFGQQLDGVALDYVDPKDDAVATYHIPADQSARNAREVETVGIRNRLQAHFHAWRAYNKLKYQRETVEFTALPEADLLVVQNRIAIADNTRPDTQDGEVIAQDGLELTLSQPVDVTGASTIFLQLYDGTVQALGVTQGDAPDKVVLSGAPDLPLSLDDDAYARTMFEIVANSSSRMRAFLLSEKNPESNGCVKVSAVNYDARYYQNDQDFVNGVIDEDGYPIEV